jgi:SAM-dependent methyltransferase
MNEGYYFDPAVAEAYDAEVAQLRATAAEADVQFYIELAKQATAAGHSVLELGCGTGRVTIPIAQAGVDVVGLDNAPAMLEVARRKAGSAANPRWVAGDMADFALDQRFGLVLIPFRSFLLLLTVEEQKACLSRIHEHLVAGGRLALNIFNPSILAIADWLGDRGQRWQRSQIGPRRERWANRRYSPASQELNETRTDLELSDAGAVIQRVERNLRVRWVWRYEMEHLLALSGFEVEALYGWFDGTPFTDESDEMVWVARRVKS